MSYARDRETFIARVVAEGLPLDTARAILRDAATIQRCAELTCSSEAADRDRVPCPKASWPGGVVNAPGCLCESFGMRKGMHRHGLVPRHEVASWRAERRIERRLPAGFGADFSGDPRGACVKLTVPSGRTDDWGGTGLCVPTKG